MGITSDLLVGIAERNAANDLGSWPNGPYWNSKTKTLKPSLVEPINTLSGMSEDPDRIIALAAYELQAGFNDADVTQPIQAHIRGQVAATSALDIADRYFDLWAGARNIIIGGVHVQQIRPGPRVAGGIDSRQRREVFVNLYFDCFWPTRYRHND